MIEAWLVDLDGTLYHSLPLRLVMAAELMLTGGRAIPVVAQFRRMHEQVRAMEERLSESDTRAPFERQLVLAAEASGTPPEVMRQVAHEWMVRRPCRWLRSFRRQSLVTELARFRASGGKTAIVSDYPAREKLASLGVSELFDCVVANGEEGGPPRMKPSPSGYLLAAQRLGVTAASCLVIGDRDDADGEAARVAGMDFRLVR